MRNRGRVFSLLIIVGLTVLSLNLISTETVRAQSVPKPSVPNFTLQIIGSSVQMKIINQLVIPNGHDTANIFYNIRIKSHDSSNWVNTTVPDQSQGIRGYIAEIGTSGSTVTQKDFNSINTLLGLPDDSHQIDYQVEAINGYLNTSPTQVPPIGVNPNSTPVVVVNTSGWSNTQTITLGSNKPSATAITSSLPTSTASSTPPLQTASASPQQPNTQSKVLLFGLGWDEVAIVGLSAALVILVAATLFYRRRSLRKAKQP